MPPHKIAVLGDLHYEPEANDRFVAARRQIADQLPHAVFQLGDHGGYSHCGSLRSFREGFGLLSGFDCPAHTILGNHDLEGAEFATDADVLSAWCELFGLERPYYTVDLGPALGVCLSSTSFRANPASQHEVRIDDDQYDWFEQTLEEHGDRPTFVFAHAPIIGSGLRVLQNIHLCCPNAWLNHTDRPERFIALLAKHPQVKLWFSAHDHLGQQYADSITQVGACTFVHTGVIGDVSRDGCRQSRVVEFDARGYSLHTLDHTSGQRVLDARHAYATSRTDRISRPQKPDETTHFAPPPMPHDSPWQIDSSVFALNRGMLLEYDRALKAPIGVVCDGLEEETRVRVVGETLVVTSPAGETTTYQANDWGRFGHVYTPNPHRGRPRLSA